MSNPLHREDALPQVRQDSNLTSFSNMRRRGAGHIFAGDCPFLHLNDKTYDPRPDEAISVDAITLCTCSQTIVASSLYGGPCTYKATVSVA